jgi:hypothetical protein
MAASGNSAQYAYTGGGQFYVPFSRKTVILTRNIVEDDLKVEIA